MCRWIRVGRVVGYGCVSRKTKKGENAHIARYTSSWLLQLDTMYLTLYHTVPSSELAFRPDKVWLLTDPAAGANIGKNINPNIWGKTQ